MTFASSHFKMRDQRLREAKWLGQGHTPTQWQNWDQLSSPLPPSTIKVFFFSSLRNSLFGLTLGKKVLDRAATQDSKIWTVWDNLGNKENPRALGLLPTGVGLAAACRGECRLDASLLCLGEENQCLWINSKRDEI